MKKLTLKKIKLSELVQLPAMSKSELQRISGGYGPLSCSCNGYSGSGPYNP